MAERRLRPITNRIPVGIVGSNPTGVDLSFFIPKASFRWKNNSGTVLSHLDDLECHERCFMRNN